MPWGADLGALRAPPEISRVEERGCRPCRLSAEGDSLGSRKGEQTSSLPPPCASGGAQAPSGCGAEALALQTQGPMPACCIHVCAGPVSHTQSRWGHSMVRGLMLTSYGLEEPRPSVPCTGVPQIQTSGASCWIGTRMPAGTANPRRPDPKISLQSVFLSDGLILDGSPLSTPTASSAKTLNRTPPGPAAP